MNTDTLRITFWGTRGSCSACHKDYISYGCNTACVSVETVEGQNLPLSQFIIDAGTGLKNLGDSDFIKDEKNINILLSHFHFDHISGLPFFKEMFNKNAVINIFARPLIYNNLYELLNSYFRPPFFPIELLGKDSSANIKFNDLSETGTIVFKDDISVKYCSVPHAEGATSFRISIQDKSVCYMSDLELGMSDDIFSDYLLDFARNSDLLILDTFFIGNHIVHGWGHSSWEQGINFAKQAEVKKIVFFHHNIYNTDKMIDTFFEKYKTLSDNIIIARDGLEIYI